MTTSDGPKTARRARHGGASGASETFLRARRPEQKQQRREDILAAARELALIGGVRGVSLAGIAARAGIDKSALLRYFETREQIFLELTAREWAPWVRALHDGLDGVAPGAADATATPDGDRRRRAGSAGAADGRSEPTRRTWSPTSSPGASATGRSSATCSRTPRSTSSGTSRRRPSEATS